MNVSKRVLAELPMVYAVTAVCRGKREYAMVASEDRAECLLFSLPDGSSSTVWEGPGGCMSLVPVGARGVVAIQEFFPIFQSEGASVVWAEPGEDLGAPWRVRRVLDLPFVHRCEVVSHGGELYLVAATLCGGKDSQDDWSQPGAVYAGRVPQDPWNDAWSVDLVLDGLSKNHGMCKADLGDGVRAFVAGQEGLFALAPGTWQSERLLECPVSDLSVADLDSDGEAEIVTIEPFHGDELVVYDRRDGAWQAVARHEVAFGHVVWAGYLWGGPAILAGSRGGEKDLALLRPRSDVSGGFSVTVIDRGVGPTQVVVLPGGAIISANHAMGEVALYERSD